MISKNISKLCVVFIVIIFTSINAQVYYSSDNGTCDAKLPSFCSCRTLRIECDCKGASVEFGSEFTEERILILMQNCLRLSVKPKSFLRHGTLRHGPFEIIFQNITDIRLLPDSFALNVLQDPRMNLTIKNSTIHNIPSHSFVGLDSEERVLTGFVGQQKEPEIILNIENCVVHKIEKSAFGDFKIVDFSISHTEVKMVDTQAINNYIFGKFKLSNSLINLDKNAIIFKGTASENGLMITNNTFKAFGDAVITGSIEKDVYITNNNFSLLTDSLFNLRVNGQVLLSNNNFSNIPGNGLRFKVRDRISIIDNDIQHLEKNAFQLITPTDAKTFIFLDGNIIRQHDPMSLCLNPNFTEDFVVIKNNIFHQECSCNITKDISQGLGFGADEDLYQDNIHQQWLQQGVCLKDMIGKERFRINIYLVQFCYNNQKLTKVLLILFAVFLILITCCVIVAWRRLRHRGMAASTSSDYHSFSAPAPSSSGQSPWAMVQPDPKTYQETEIHIVFDNAQELARYSMYSEGNTPTKRITRNGSSECKNENSEETPNVCSAGEHHNTGEKNCTENKSCENEQDSNAKEITDVKEVKFAHPTLTLPD